ncbi:MAG: extracellular solute-binding protein [bacterium]|nr:extracellular solute-binding protein [bacterium]
MTPARARRAAAIVLAALAGCAGVLASGCGRPHDDPDRLTFWALGGEGEVVERLLPEFTARHPGLRVTVQRIPWSAAHEKLLTAWVGGAMPDVVQVGNTWIPELVVLGALEPLDDRLDAAARAAFFPGVLDPNVVDGRTWGVPWYVDTRLVFYRRDLLAAAGEAEAPRTWDAWRAGMQAVQARARPGQHAILLPLTEWQPLVILAFGHGATLLRDGDCRGDFRSPAFRAALTAWVRLFRDGLAPLGGAALAANLYEDFARGDVAFVVTGPWNLGELARRLPPALADAWTTMPMPAVTGAPPGPSLAGGASLAVVRGTPRAEAAWKLVAFLAEPAQQRRLWELTGDLPARREVWDDAALAGDPRVAAFRTQLEAVRATPKIPEWERIAGKIMQWADTAVRGTLDVDAATARLDAEVDAILAKRRWLLGDRCTAGTAPAAAAGGGAVPG